MPFWDLYCKYLVKNVLCLEIILNLPSCVLLCQSHCLPRSGSTWLFGIPRVCRLPVNLRIIGQMQVANAANEPPCIVECLAQLSRLRFTWLLVMYSFQANIKQILSGKPCCPVPSALLPFLVLCFCHSGPDKVSNCIWTHLHFWKLHAKHVKIMPQTYLQQEHVKNDKLSSPATCYFVTCTISCVGT